MHVPPNAASLQLNVFHDEDVEIYFDGVLAARAGGYVADARFDGHLARRETATQTRAHSSSWPCIVIKRPVVGVDVRLEPVSQERLAIRRRARVCDFAISNPGDAAAGQPPLRERPASSPASAAIDRRLRPPRRADLLTIGDNSRAAS